MIGVLIALGDSHKHMAKTAGERFTQTTGLPYKILTEDEFRACGARDPFTFRMNVFDFVDDERVVYFDDDIFWLQPWKPEDLVPVGTLGVVKDLTYFQHIIHDCLDAVRCPSGNYFNAGLLIMDRSHLPFLKLASQLAYRLTWGYTHFLDQSALNLARYLTEIPTKFLDRRYNWVGNAGTWAKQGYPIIGAHKGVVAVYEPKWKCPEVFKEWSGYYHYGKEGQQKLLELREDGSMGVGTKSQEWNWMPYQKGDETGILIRGLPSWGAGDIEIVWARKDGDVFRGKNLIDNGLEVVLERCTEAVPELKTCSRADILTSILRSQFPDKRVLDVVEIGVDKGEVSAALLYRFPNLHLTMVDSGDFDHRAAEVMVNTQFASDRVLIVRHPSDKACHGTHGGGFDMICIGGNRNAKDLHDDMGRWWDRTRKNTVLVGYNYGAEIAKVVDVFAAHRKLKVEVGADATWWIAKDGTQAIQSRPVTVTAVEDPELQQYIQELTGKRFWYVRVGLDRRLISLEAGGEVGIGRMGFEQIWSIKIENGPVLTLGGSVEDPICHLRRGGDQIWRGDWIKGGKVSIELVDVPEENQQTVSTPVAVAPIKSNLKPNKIEIFKQYQAMAAAYIAGIGPYPEDRFQGRGIVICCGGGYFALGWIVVNILRRLGCTLPVQFWHLGAKEMGPQMRDIVQPLGVTCVDAEEVRREHPVKKLCGWELKPFSMLWSPFEEVILIDADNVPLVNPEFLFETEAYKSTGSTFWPDRGRYKPQDEPWELFQVPYQDEPQFESGQMVINKRRCWRELQLAMHYNENSEFYYRHVHGDKDTYHYAWRRLGTPYGMVPHGVKEIRFTMCQHDFEGRRIFQHRGVSKLVMGKENLRSPGFEREDECFDLLKTLNQKWDGTVK